MSKNLIIISFVVVVLVVAGVLVLGKTAPQPTPTVTEDVIEVSGEKATEEPADKTETEGSAMSEGKTAVNIQNFTFSPATITVKKGTTVTWTNKDSVGHTVTSDTGNELDSDLLGQGASYSHTFSTTGTFAYHCTPHPNMKATVVVE